MTHDALISSGVVLLTVVAIAFGGWFLLRVVAGEVPVNEFQRASFRAGHAHAGVLVTLGLVVIVLTQQSGVPAWAGQLGTGVLWAAILMPLGFFLSVIGRDSQRRNGWRWCIYLGGIALCVGVVAAGAGLIVGGVAGV